VFVVAVVRGHNLELELGSLLQVKRHETGDPAGKLVNCEKVGQVANFGAEAVADFFVLALISIVGNNCRKKYQ